MNFARVCQRAGVLFLAASMASAQTPPVSALFQGVLGEDLTAISAALDAGADPNGIDPQVRHTGVHVAVAPGGPRNADIVELLAHRGANLNLPDPELQLTPLMAAMVVKDNGPFGVVERARAQVLVAHLLRLGANANAAVEGGQTALMFAAGMNNLAAVRALLASGAEPNLRNAQGASALHAAYPPGGSTEVISTLLAAGANPELRDNAGLKPGELPVTPVPATIVETVDVPLKPVAPAPPAPTKSNWNKWLIGGAVVAATVVGAVVLDALVKEQKKKNGVAADAVALAPPSTPVPIPGPAPVKPVGVVTGAWIIPQITMLQSLNGQMSILAGPNQGSYGGWSYRLSWCGPGSRSGCIDFKTMASYTPQDVLEDRDATNAIDKAARAMFGEVQKINAAIYKRGRPAYPSEATFTRIIDESIREGIAAKSVATAVLAARARLAAAGFPVDIP